MPTSRRTGGSTATAWKPAKSSESTAPAAGCAAAGAVPGMPASTSAAATKTAAVAPNASSMLVSASSTAQSAGPTKLPTPSSVVDAAFAAVSSAGVRASVGRSAACAGQKIVESRATTIPSAYTGAGGEPARIARAVTAVAPARTRFATSMTRWRG